MADSENSNRWLLWGGALLGVVLLIAVGLFTLPTGSTGSQEQDEDTPSESPDTDQESASDEPSASEESSPEAATCEDTDADSSFPTEAPDFEWEDFEMAGGLSLPVSEEHGPSIQEEGFWRCFSQTPSGAAFAAPSLFLSFVAGEQYEAAVDSPGADSARPPEGADTAEQFDGILLRGFRIGDSSDEDATVELWFSSPEDEADLGYEFELVWDEESNDWRLDLGSGGPQPTELTNTAEFTEWG